MCKVNVNREVGEATEVALTTERERKRPEATKNNAVLFAELLVENECWCTFHLSPRHLFSSDTSVMGPSGSLSSDTSLNLLLPARFLAKKISKK